jgi:cytochrome c-type biogenesis protein CcmH/NrfG
MSAEAAENEILHKTYMQLNPLDEAEEAIQSACSLHEQCINSENYAENLARCWKALGDTCMCQGKHLDAEVAFRAAQTLF